MHRLILFILCLLDFLPAHGRMLQVGVLDLSAINVSAGDAQGVSELLRGEFVNRNVYVVIDRGKMPEVLKEQAFQSSGCTETACAMKVGQLLNMLPI